MFRLNFVIRFHLKDNANVYVRFVFTCSHFGFKNNSLHVNSIQITHSATVCQTILESYTVQKVVLPAYRSNIVQTWSIYGCFML